MKKSISTLALLTLLSPLAHAETTTNGCEHPFTDIVATFAEENICLLYTQGVIEGYSEKSFLPNNKITRAEFLKMILVMHGYSVYSVASAAFTDSVPGDWSYRYVTFGHSKGFVSGYTDGSFHPNESITRAEAVELVINISGIINSDTSNVTHNFTDVLGTDWFAGSVAEATAAGIIEGYGDGSFRPNDALTRAEAATIVERAWESLN